MKNSVKLLIIVLVVLGIVLAQSRWDIAEKFSTENISGWLDSAGIYAPLFYIAMMALAIIFSPIPSLPLDIAAGRYFGPIPGTIYSVIGATLGATISFLLARFLGRSIIERFLRGHIHFCTQCSNKLLTKIVFLSRLIPVVSFDVISYGAGLTKMSLPAFMLSTCLGMIPLTFLYNYSGAIISFDTWVSMLIGGVFVLIFFLFPRLIERYNIFRLKTYFAHASE